MFREMAKEMTDGEIRKCMAILVEDSVVLEIYRDTVQNAVDVTFRVIGEAPDKLYELSLLSDSVDLRTEGIPLRIDGEYLYIQYLVAKRYSQYWKGNIFAEEE